ncbi:PIR protein, putative [Plasmodium sp.]|nr:PIR protein, putative [Plasmodium sp.]
MKLHCPKILLFSLLLNILVSSSSNENNKNKPYITLHTSTTTSRGLSECDLQKSIYDNDPHMKSVKENFDRQTSQRFEEYNQRMIKKRKKCKEQCDKDIEQIILRDKTKKSLEETIERVCLKCGCGLGGVAAGVGIIGPIAVNEWTKAALFSASQKGIQEGIAKAIQGVKEIYILGEVECVNFGKLVTTTNFSDQNLLGHALQTLSNEICVKGGVGYDKSFCLLADGRHAAKFSQGIAEKARDVALNARQVAKTAEEVERSLANSASTQLYNAIGYSVLAIFIMLLVMIIIYLILRYRRKKKMNKKLQYTKLLNQ